MAVRAGNQQRNFFPQYGDNDTFDIERVDFGRGPNSMLFGNGTRGGTNSATIKRARTDRAFQTVQFSTGSWSTHRATFDVNQPMGKRVAVRTAGVWGDGGGWREQDFNRRKGVFTTTTFRPWKITEIRLEGEYLGIQKQTGKTTLNERLSGWNGALTYNTPDAQTGADAHHQIFQFRRSQIEGRILDQKQPLVKLFADYTLHGHRAASARRRLHLARARGGAERGFVQAADQLQPRVHCPDVTNRGGPGCRIPDPRRSCPACNGSTLSLSSSWGRPLPPASPSPLPPRRSRRTSCPIRRRCSCSCRASPSGSCRWDCAI